MTEQHAAQAPALRERHPQIFNFQYPIINSGRSRAGKSQSQLNILLRFPDRVVPIDAQLMVVQVEKR